MRILVIVPAYNEEGNLPGVLHDLADSGIGADILVVNDGSLDRTSGIARSISGVMVADLPLNLGIGGAVQTGLIYARDHGYDVAVQFDGDGQHRADQIPLILASIIEGSDLVIGSRFLGAGEGGYKVPFMRRLGIIVLSSVISAVSGVRITDGTSGFRAMGFRAIEAFACDYPEDYPEVEAVIMARRLGLKVREVPVMMKARQWGHSSITPLYSIYYVVKVLLAIAVRMGRVG